MGRRRPVSYGKSFNFLYLCRMRYRHPGRSRFFGGAFIFHSASFSRPSRNRRHRRRAQRYCHHGNRTGTRGSVAIGIRALWVDSQHKPEITLNQLCNEESQSSLMEGVVSLAVQGTRAVVVSMADMSFSFVNVRRARDTAGAFLRNALAKQNFPFHLPNLPQYFSLSGPSLTII